MAPLSVVKIPTNHAHQMILPVWGKVIDVVADLPPTNSASQKHEWRGAAREGHKLPKLL